MLRVACYLQTKAELNRIFRLKKVQGKKKRDTAARDAAQLALKESKPDHKIDNNEDEAMSNFLSSKDEDVIF